MMVQDQRELNKERARVEYRLVGGLSDEQLADVHEKAMSLIEKIGLQVEHVGIRKRLADYDGVRIDGDMVTFDPSLVERKLGELHYNLWEGLKITAGAYSLNVTDLATGEIRSSTHNDLVNLLKLADSYGLEGCAPVTPLDLPEPMREIAMYKACFEHSQGYGWGYGDQTPNSTIAAARYVYEMSKAVDRPFSLPLWIISPFRTTTSDLDIIYDFLDEGIAMWVDTMPIAGMTAPIHMIGAYIQSLAELFAGYTLLCLVNPKGYNYLSVIDSIRAYPCDMRFGSFVYGSPEDAQATLLQMQLNRHYGIPVVARSLLSSAKEPDGHAAAEKAAHTMAALCFGAKGFCDPGLLSVDEVFSAEQLVVDMEIVEYCTRFARGLEYDEETSSIDAIMAVGVGGSFLDHETTLAHYRDAFWSPQLFEHSTLGTWREKGGLSVRDRARENARKRIARHEYELEKEKSKELEQIYRSAQAELT